MPANVADTIRRLTIEAVSKGIEAATAALNKLRGAQEGVTVASRSTEKATQSMQNRLNSIQRQYDQNFRATEQLAKVTRDLEKAEAQGLVTSSRKNELLKLAADRYRSTSSAVGLHERATNALTSSIGRLVAAYLSWQAISGAVRFLLDQTVESERAQTQLATVVASTGGTAGLTATQLSDLAVSLQRTSTYGDEGIKSAEGLLLTFTKIGKGVFPDAVEATLNLATALHTDLDGAAKQLGKALNDPIKGMTTLQRAGVTFTAQQKATAKSMVESGNVAGAQRLILNQLGVEYGNTARAARDTLGGALAALKNAWGDVFEANGPESEQMRSAIEQIVTRISDPSFISAVQSFGIALFNAIDAVLPGVTKILQLVSWVGDAAEGQKPMSIPNWGKLDGDNTSMKAHLSSMLGNGDMFPNGPIHFYQGRSIPETSLTGGAYPFGDMSGFFNDATRKNVATLLAPPPPPPPRKLTSDLTEDQIKELDRQAKAYGKLTDSATQRIGQAHLEVQTLGMTDEATARLTITQDLLNKAANDNITLTPKQIGALQQLGAETAAAEEQARKLKDAYDFGKQTLNSFFSDLKSNLLNSTSLWDSFRIAGANALDHIADKALGMAADGVWDLIFNAFKGALGGGFGTIGIGGVTAPSGGFIPGLTGPSLFDAGGYTGNRATSQVAGVVHGREYVFSAPATARIGVRNLDRMHDAARGYAGGGYVQPAASNANWPMPANADAPVTIAPVYNFVGSGFGKAEAMELMARNNRALIDTLPAALADARRRGKTG